MTSANTTSPAGASSDAPARRGAPARLIDAALALPGWAWALLFFLLPTGFLVVSSFGSMNFDTGAVEFGWTLENYATLLDPVYLGAFARSILLTLLATATCLVIGFPAGYAIARLRGAWQTVLLIGVIIPFWTSFVVRVYAWLDMLGPNGLFTGSLIEIGLLPAGTDLRYTDFAVYIGLVYTYLPLMILPIYATLERLDDSLLAAGSDLGLSKTRSFWRIVVPLSAPGVLAGCLLVGIPALGEYTIPVILGGQRTLMLGSLISNQFTRVGDFAYGSAIVTALIVIVLGILGLAARARRRKEQSA